MTNKLRVTQKQRNYRIADNQALIRDINRGKCTVDRASHPRNREKALIASDNIMPFLLSASERTL